MAADIAWRAPQAEAEVCGGSGCPAEEVAMNTSNQVLEPEVQPTGFAPTKATETDVQKDVQRDAVRALLTGWQPRAALPAAVDVPVSRDFCP